MQIRGLNKVEWRGAGDKLARKEKYDPMGKLDSQYMEYVYFVEAEDHGKNFIKIGRSTNLRKRLRSLQAMNPGKLRLVGVVVAPIGMEGCLHSLFHDSRQHGEWFGPSDKLLAFLSGEKARKIKAWDEQTALSIFRSFGAGEKLQGKINSLYKMRGKW